MHCRSLAIVIAAPLALFAGLTVPAAETLPGTEPLRAEGDLAARMVTGIDRFLLRQTDESIARRGAVWKRDTSSAKAYVASVEPNRQHLRRIIGAVDPRVEVELFRSVEANEKNQAECGGAGHVRWSVLGDSQRCLVHGEAVLLKAATNPPKASVIVLPDADQAPEDLLAPPAEGGAAFPLRLAASGCRVVIPVLINRDDQYSLVAGRRRTNQPHREFIYRGAYEMGRHLIGYEVQKVLALVDWLEKKSEHPIGVIGYGEGGLIALYAAALDPRINACCVSGYFNSRQNLWQEPIYRNVWSLLTEFGDAEVASLVAPRPLVIEAAPFPRVDGPPQPADGKSGAAPGTLVTPPAATITAEVERARALVRGLEPQPAIELITAGAASPWSDEAVGRFLALLADDLEYRQNVTTAIPRLPAIDAQRRQRRQVEELVEYNQFLMREGEYRRREFWSRADASSVDAWRGSTVPYREYFATEVIGRIDQPRLPPRPRARQIYDEPAYRGYEVMLDVFPDVFAYGILLVPKDIKPGQRCPVVVCQHGLEGRPTDVADPKTDHPAYHRFACRLAEQGFITYAPQNPYIGQDNFRTLQRKANPLKLSLFSFIVPQHQTSLDWLASLPVVDSQRIAFYGLSYGGKTAMRVPALVPQYCLSICSADFNEWIWKNVSSRSPFSYLGTGEYEMVEFDLGNTFNYAEMAGLIAPRPFMVERGHHDGVAPDEWVAYEYAKVRLLYNKLKLADRTTIEFFDGPHTIHGVGTFAFLHEHLRWPPPGGRQ